MGSGQNHMAGEPIEGLRGLMGSEIKISILKNEKKFEPFVRLDRGGDAGVSPVSR